MIVEIYGEIHTYSMDIIYITNVNNDSNNNNIYVDIYVVNDLNGSAYRLKRK